MKLSFNETQGFILCKEDGLSTIQSLDLRQAAKLLKYADLSARKVLDRAIVKFYDDYSLTNVNNSLPGFLDPHQKEGVQWVLSRQRSYLAHAPGAGKTCEAIVSALLSLENLSNAQNKEMQKIVFIVPPSLTANWAREIHKFYELMYKGNTKAFPTIYNVGDTSEKDIAGWEAQFYIVPDSMLTRDWVLKALLHPHISIHFLAVDEASRFKNPEASRTIALFGGTLNLRATKIKCEGLIYRPKHVVLMDGSPMPNRPMELWAPLYAMAPQTIDFMSEQEFGFKYCGAKLNSFGKWEFKHASNGDELRARITKNFMHVVPESALSHPERQRTMLFMDVDARSPKHKEWEKSNLSKINLSQISEDAASQGDLASFRHELGMRKVPWVAEYVSERLKEKNEQILLFAWHRDVCFELEWKLRKFKPGLIIGGIPDDQRQKDFDAFQQGHKKLLILNIAAGGRGHNLQRAGRVIFAEFSWTNETNLQCEKRASRKGSDKTHVRCEYIVSPNSMDEIILNAVFRKAKTVKEIIG